MTGQIPQREIDRMCKYTSAAAAKEEAGFLRMEEYVRQLQNTAA